MKGVTNCIAVTRFLPALIVSRPFADLALDTLCGAKLTRKKINGVAECHNTTSIQPSYHFIHSLDYYNKITVLNEHNAGSLAANLVSSLSFDGYHFV